MEKIQLIRLCNNDVIKIAAIFETVEISNRQETYVTPWYIGQYCAEFKINRTSSFCVVQR